MKALVLLAAVLFQIEIQWVHSQYPAFDSRVLRCIPVQARDDNTRQIYNKLQVLTNLIRVPLRDIARFQLVAEDNPFYNQFLTCSWKEYEYQTKQGDIVFDAIERSLKDALIREVDATGPGINLSKLEAKKIVNNCKNVRGYTHGHTVVQVQNCIHRQIQHLSLL